MNLDVGTAEINGEVTYTLLARIYVKNVIENTEKILRPHSINMDQHFTGGII